MSPSPSERLRSLGIELPPPASPKGSYSPAVRDGTHVYVSGQIVTDGGTAVHPGRVDEDLTVDQAKALARQATLQALSSIAALVGSVDRIRRVLRVGVYVASSDGFTRQHEVGNGATELLIEIFGEAGRPARVSMGVPRLPLNAPVEVELLAATD